MAGRARFRWDANDPGCLLVEHEGPGTARLPFLQPIGEGDSDAFAPRDRVSVQVTDFAGSDSCELRLMSVDTGRVVDLGEPAVGQDSVVRDPGGAPRVYLAGAACVVRLSDA